ncbi:hypothetical protein PT974_12191 [Cladobotryum mycophilum]|uniref:Uncharacterized protein n=1 Tax=Cladobotryum mycophilum TaxID=491253 RepID=A0ABR0S8F8_9HYPO
MATIPILPPSPHLIQICAAVINQYSMASHQLRECLQKQSQDMDRQRLEIQGFQRTLSELQNENQQLRDAIFEQDRMASETAATARMQHQIVITQRNLIASLEHDLAQARPGNTEQISTGPTPCYSQTAMGQYANSALSATSQQSEGAYAAAHEAWQGKDGIVDNCD